MAPIVSIPPDMRAIQALVFDMDGTLVDSEINTERAVEHLLASRGIPENGLDKKQFYGITWQAIGGKLRQAFPELEGMPVEEPLQQVFHDLFADTPYIPQALEFFVTSAREMPVAIATSSNRESVESLLKRMGAGTLVQRISAEDYSKSKPDPECYLLAAKNLGIDIDRCVIFEDSIPGLQAAKASGAFAVAVVARSSDRKLAREIAHMAITDYSELPPDFLAVIRS